MVYDKSKHPPEKADYRLDNVLSIDADSASKSRESDIFWNPRLHFIFPTYIRVKSGTSGVEGRFPRTYMTHFCGSVTLLWIVTI